MSANQSNDTIVKQLVIDSKQRNTGTAENFKVFLDSHIAPTHFAISRAEIPVTWYNIDATKNTLKIIEVATPFTVTLTPGYYINDSSRSNDISAQLKTALDAGSPTSKVYTVSVSVLTGKMTISTSVNIGLTVVGEQNSVAGILGFTLDIAAGSGSFTSPNIVNLSDENYILIKSDKLSSIQHFASHDTPNNDHHVAKVPITTNVNGIQFYTRNEFGVEGMTEVSHVRPFRTLDFKITRVDGTPLLLNGPDWSLTLSYIESK